MGCGSGTSIKVADESAIGEKTVVPKSSDVVVHQPESPQSIVPVASAPSAPDIVITQSGQLRPQETARAPSPETSSPRLRLRVPSISIATNEARYRENSADQGEEVNDASPDRLEGFSSSSSRDPSPSSPSGRQASRRSNQSARLRSHSKASLTSGGSRGSHLSIPQSQDVRRPSTADRSSQPSSAGERDAVAELLGKEVLHSGSLMQETIRVRALQGCETLSEAIQALPKPDQHMPNFDVKVDPENMLLKLPHDIFKPNQLSLQRVSFMGTKWIALRLCAGSREQCMKFCMVAASLQNLGRNTSRSVVVEACEALPLNSSKVRLDIPGFVCTPIPRDALVSTTVSWLEIWQDVIEITEIILNEASLPGKKVTAELKKWVLKVGQRAKDPGGSRSRFSFLSAITAQTAPTSPRLKRRAMSESQIPEFGTPETFRDRSHSEADLEGAGQPSGPFSNMAKWVKGHISLNGVFNSLEDQLASLTPPPEVSSPRLRRNSSGSLSPPRSRDEKRESRKSSKSSTSSNGRRRASNASSSESDTRGPDSRRNSASSSASRRRSTSWPGPLPEDNSDYSDNVSGASLPSSSSVNGDEPEPSSPLMRRKSSSHLQMMPVLHEGVQDLSEKNLEDEDEDDDQKTPPPKITEDDEDAEEAPALEVVEDEDDEKEAPPLDSLLGPNSAEPATD